jgi:hypothetical protein
LSWAVVSKIEVYGKKFNLPTELFP